MSRQRKILIGSLLALNIVIAIVVYFILNPGQLNLPKNNVFFNTNYSFAEKLMLLFLAAVPLLSLYYIFRNEKNHAHIRYSDTSILASLPSDFKEKIRHLPIYLRLLGLTFLILALARPQSNLSWENSDTEGIDIVLAVDVSVSMLAKDFPGNRLEAAKSVAVDFIDERPNDRVGLVIYEGESFTQVPLTTDHTVVKDMFASLQPGMLEGGTAIGMGLATSVKRLTDSDAKSKVIILLTDGVNNSGNIQPVDAASLAKEYGIRVYTIGVGSLGKALSPVGMYPNGTYQYERVEVKIDEASLTEISRLTGGKYFRAKNMKSLEKIYEEIDKMEKTIIKVTEHRKKSEEYYNFVLLGGILILLEFLFRHFILRKQI